MTPAARPARGPGPQRGRGAPALIVSVVTAADLVSTAWAAGSLPAAGQRIGGLQLRLVTNRGVAFGIGAGHPVLVGVVGLLGTAALCWWLRRAATVGERVAVAVALGGALGNLFERLTDGAVTDWIHLWPYPATFNLADVAVRAGLVVAVALRLLRQPASHRTWACWLAGMRGRPGESRESGGFPEGAGGDDGQLGADAERAGLSPPAT